MRKIRRYCMKCKSGGDGRRRGRRRWAWIAFLIVVTFYLIRLEAFTPADIILPWDYLSAVEQDGHSTSEAKGSDGQERNAWLEGRYRAYTWQQNRPYTIREDILLSRLAYLKAPQGFRGETQGMTVRELCEKVMDMVSDPSLDTERALGRDREELLELISEVSGNDRLGSLTICEYLSTASGLAGYVLEKGGELTIAFRGTDDIMDALDNFILLPFNLSVQYKDIRMLLEKYGGAERIWLTGHSKGGHNAIYAASLLPNCYATGFNAPGFGIFLSDAQHDGLASGVNYVMNGDITGFLLFHLERRAVLESERTDIAVKGITLNKKHRLDNFFSVDHLVVATEIQPLSIWSEWITQIAWLLLVFLMGYGLIVCLPGWIYSIAREKMSKIIS